MKKNVIHLFLMLCLLTNACQEFEKMNAHSVCDVMSDPRKFSLEKSVSVEGKVLISGSIYNMKGFVIGDTINKCELMVKTERITPIEGTVIVVKGKLKEMFSLGGIKVLYLEEE